MRVWHNQINAALHEADVQIDGDQAWDIQLRDERFYRRIARRGVTGFADAYVDGWWECEAIDQLYDRLLSADLSRRLWMCPAVMSSYLSERLFNTQRPLGALRNSRSHYNLGNDLFRAMLDERMTYSCGYWQSGAPSLDAAQTHKLELICRKLALTPGMRVLDIGCGWGSFIQYAASHYGCQCVGITLSEQQEEEARQRCVGLPVEVRMQDYREVDERFDRVVSVGMFEHVGPKNYAAYMCAVRRCLEPDGLCLLHFFATQRPWPNVKDTELYWIQQRVFPGLVVPALSQVAQAMADRFVLEDLQNFGADYDPTLLAWWRNFEHGWPRLEAHYGPRFYRLWKHYLLSCAGAFRSRKYQLWQLVLSPRGVRGGYDRTLAHVEVVRRSGGARLMNQDAATRHTRF